MNALEKWAPLPDLDILERRMRRFFEDMGAAPTVTPAADVYETGSELVVELDVPGFDEEELTVSVSDHTLTIVGDRHQETAEEKKAMRVRERIESHFERRFQLPLAVDTEHVAAEYGKGVLTLHVPKLATATPRTVPIEKK